MMMTTKQAESSLNLNVHGKMNISQEEGQGGVKQLRALRVSPLIALDGTKEEEQT